MYSPLPAVKIKPLLACPVVLGPTALLYLKWWCHYKKEIKTVRRRGMKFSLLSALFSLVLVAVSHRFLIRPFCAVLGSFSCQIWVHTASWSSDLTYI